MPVLLRVLVVGWLAVGGVVWAADADHRLRIRSELEAMLHSDQLHRQKFADVSQRFDPNAPEIKALEDEQQRLDAANVQRLQEIVAEAGWPKVSEVGKQAATAAFLVLQHADLALQERLVDVFRAAVAEGEADPADLALLEDRLLMRHGKPQRYGSQVEWDQQSGSARFFPIEDEAHVDDRRAAVGLMPIADYAKLFGIDYRPAKSDE